MANKTFVHLHVHSDSSSLDGLSTPEEYVEKLKANDMPAMALTDHGVMCGVPEFYSKMRKAGLEPIIGSEMYYVPDADWRPPKGSKEKHVRHHMTVLARGEAGYRVLTELSTESHRRFYNKPLVDRALLESLSDKDRAQLVVTSGCVGGAVPSWINEGRVGQSGVLEHPDDRMAAAATELAWWREMFPHFYMEIMHHDTPFDEHVNGALIKLARRYRVPLLATNDPHFADDCDADSHDMLLAIQTGSDVDDPERFRFEGHGYHLRTRKEMLDIMRRYGRSVWEEASGNTVKVAQDCHTRIPDWERRQWHIPRYPDADDSVLELKRQTIKGLKRVGKFKDPVYVAQAKHELEVFAQVGLEDFLLITADLLNEARRRGIPVGPGRGSVCGSLVNYLLDIHKIDPIKYDLRFDRFLNIERPKMPDIDSDFGKARRSEMFDYVREKYGDDNVVAVAAFQKMKIKRAWQTIAKAHGVPFEKRMEVSKGLPDEEDGVEDALPPEIVEAYPGLVDTIIRFNGVKAGVSSHPAGVIIADPRDKIRELVPEMWLTSSKKMVGQYDLTATEDSGLLKEDMLSLRVLDTIAEAVRLIEGETGVTLDPDSWVPDEEEGDDEIYKMIAEGDTGGIFQMEGPTNMRGCKAVKPECFEDLVSITSLYRTGPINAGFPKIFLANRMNPQGIVYVHPTLEEILKPTFGVILYQEQVMRIGELLAGFNMSQVDDIKEAIKKKKSSMMDTLKPVFYEGCKRVSGMSPRDIDPLWNAIEGYSGYSYNRCLTGDTVVTRGGSGPHGGGDITIAELAERWAGKDSTGKKYRRQGVSVLSYVGEGRIKPRQCVAVHDNGVQSVYRITLANGMSIKSTHNHRHLTVDGWKQTDEMSSYDRLVVNLGKEQRSTTGLGRGWASGADRAIASDGRNRPTLHGNHAALQAVKELLPDHCEFCGEEEGRLEAAHLDHDRTNNDRENVKTLCNRCHKKHDRERRSMDSGGPRFSKGFKAGSSRVVAVEYVGEEQTYDLEMDDPGHNFVANGIVTHNSHAVAYSFVTYQTARLKKFYPLAFAAALLRTVDPSKQNEEKRAWYLRDALRQGIAVLPPAINISMERATPDPEAGAMRFGLADISGVGEKTAQRIIEARPPGGFATLQEVTKAVNNSGTMKALEAASVLESLGLKGDPTRTEELLRWTFTDPMDEVRDQYADYYFPPTDSRTKVRVIGVITRVTHATTKNGKPYVNWRIRWSLTESWHVRLWSETRSKWGFQEGAIVACVGEWDDKWGNVSVGKAKNIKLLRRA